MKTKVAHLLGAVALGAVALYAQPTTGPVYWSVTAPDCTSLNETSPITIKDASGKTLGYSCYASGTFVWLAAGQNWGTTIRASAPASGPVGVVYSFYDKSGNPQNLDTTINNVPSSFATVNQVSFALKADQPTEVELLGAANNGPSYTTAAQGSIYAVFYCPDANTCGNLMGNPGVGGPQLLYSELPKNPWFLSVPMSFDNWVWTQWSTVGVNNPSANQFTALVIYNYDTVATTFKISIFDNTGALVASAVTPSIAAGQNLGNGTYGQGGTYADLLSNIVPSLPQGVFKILVDGGSYYSAVSVLQFNGPAAASLQVLYDNTPITGAANTVAAARRTALRTSRVESMPKEVFAPAPR